MNNYIDQQIKSLNINCDDITEKECYNDYMIKLNNKIIIKELDLKQIDIPLRENENITELNNKLLIEIESCEKTFELEPNYYNRYELVEFLNEGFIANSLNINCSITANDKFLFKSEKKFTMKYCDNSILSYIGFNKSQYINKQLYEADTSIDIGDNIYYLIIENIDEEPIFLINKDNDTIEKLKELDEEINIDHLIIKFCKTKKNIISNNKENSFFFEKNHNLLLEFN
jgi:hypothetical protein